MATRGTATYGPASKLEPFNFERRVPGADDVLIEILYCGICQPDIHQARDEWGTSMFPMVPGHEIVGRVAGVGSDVKRFKDGVIAGVGCVVDSCRECGSCADGEEQYCEGHRPLRYNSYERDGTAPTYGGYSSQIVVDHINVLTIPEGMDLAGTALLLCAGVTTYSPLKHFGVQKGDSVGVVGLGGLGQVAVKLVVSMGARATVTTIFGHGLVTASSFRLS